MSDLTYYIVAIVTVFAVVDPIGTLPFFAAFTGGYGPEDRRIVLERTVLVFTSILIVFALVGRFLFAAFGFTLAAFEIAGGILLFIVAYDMLRGEVGPTKLTAADRDEAIQRRDEVSIFPLAIPLLAGPGAISTVMIYAGGAGAGPASTFAAFVAVLITGAATFVIFRLGQRILDAIGRVGVMALTRVLGLLLAAVAVQFVISGVYATFP
ncbi:MAG: MarC family protein [Thermoplasmata archaeon]